jgi:non-ribosomal peptide synthase protein (TIGR01720 family)
LNSCAGGRYINRINVLSQSRCEPVELPASIKGQLRRIPDRGISYGPLRYMSTGGGRAFERSPRAEIIFNYLGQFDDVASGESLSPGSTARTLNQDRIDKALAEFDLG